jgi:AraC-like DNA-binding protein
VTLTFRFGAETNGHSVRFRAALTPGFAAFTLRFEGVVFDNRALPPRPPRGCPWHLLLLVAEGSILWNDRELGAGSMLLAPEQLVLPSAPVGVALRSHRGPVEIVALRLPSWTLLGDHKRVRPVEPDRKILLAVEAVADLLRCDDPPAGSALELALAAVWGGLRDAHQVAGSAPLSPRDERAAGAEHRVSEVLSLALSQLEQNPQLVDLVGHARVGERQLLRDIVEIQSRFGFVLRGWRDTLNWWRLVAATLFLGAPELSVGEIARAVGFASTTTMARAFRNAGLSQPTAVRTRLRAPVSLTRKA